MTEMTIVSLRHNQVKQPALQPQDLSKSQLYTVTTVTVNINNSSWDCTAQKQLNNNNNHHNLRLPF